MIDQLCRDLQRLTDDNADPQIVAVQVKEKFGSLRFYIRDASDAQRVLIATASKQSITICSLCGAQKVLQDDRWR